VIEENKTLRQIILEHFLQVETMLYVVKRAMEQMAKNTIVSDYELTQLKYQVGALSESLDTLEQRVVVLEKHASSATLVIRHGLTLLLGVAVVLALNYYVFNG
jgi:hypothetical protein